MPKTKKPKMGRPLSGDSPLVRRVSSYFSVEESSDLERAAWKLQSIEGAPVTTAEVIRRAVREFLERHGLR